jgi:hypothetical protein
MAEKKLPIFKTIVKFDTFLLKVKISKDICNFLNSENVSNIEKIGFRTLNHFNLSFDIIMAIAESKYMKNLKKFIRFFPLTLTNSS